MRSDGGGWRGGRPSTDDMLDEKRGPLLRDRAEPWQEFSYFFRNWGVAVYLARSNIERSLLVDIREDQWEGTGFE